MKSVRVTVDTVDILCPKRFLNQNFKNVYKSFYCKVSPLYTDSRYNDQIRYNNNLTGTKPSLKITVNQKLYKNIVFIILQET